MPPAERFNIAREDGRRSVDDERPFLSGVIFRLGHGINTDEIIPARHCRTADRTELGLHCLEIVDPAKLPGGQEQSQPFPQFRQEHVGPIIIVAGRDFGSGSSREQAVVALQEADVSLVIAESFASIFRTNSHMSGLPILTRQQLDQLQGRVGKTLDSERLEIGDTIDFPFSVKDIHSLVEDPVLKAVVEEGGIWSVNLEGLYERQRFLMEQAGVPLRRPKSLVEKLIARSLGWDVVPVPGSWLVLPVDRVYAHDYTAHMIQADLIAWAAGLPVNVFNPRLVYVFADHQITDPEAPGMQAVEWFKDQVGLTQAFPLSKEGVSQGICHELMSHIIHPGEIVVGSDSHTTSGGANGAFAFGAGGSLVGVAMMTGLALAPMPDSIGANLEGKLHPGVSSRDVYFHLVEMMIEKGIKRPAEGSVIEFGGEGVGSLAMPERADLATMVFELGAVSGIFPADQSTAEFLGLTEVELLPDQDASYNKVFVLNLTDVESYIALPTGPTDVLRLKDLLEREGRVPIQKAVIGSCVGGRLREIALVAEIIARYGPIADNVNLVVNPASLNILELARELGYVRIIEEAGGVVTPPGCGACIGQGIGAARPNETIVASFTRNYPGRVGDPSATVYLASATTVAASAIRGELATVEMLEAKRQV